MRVLRLILSGPVMSFGGHTVNANRPSERLPGRSMLTGLLANALGWDHLADADRHDALQARLRFAAVHLTPFTRPEEDFRTAFTTAGETAWSSLGEPIKRGGHPKTHAGGPVNAVRTLLPDAQVGVAITLLPGDGPGLDDLARALEAPARTLYLGRKGNLPDRPLLEDIVDAQTPVDALRGLMSCPRELARFDPDCGPDIGTEKHVADLMDWRAHVHRGSSPVREAWIDAATNEDDNAAAGDTVDPETRHAEIPAYGPGGGDLHLVRLKLNGPTAAHWLVRHGLDLADPGYRMHALLRRVLGAPAPQPFRVDTDAPGGPKIVGYADTSAPALARIAESAGADGLIQRIDSAPVPDLTLNATAAFDLTAVPTTRVRGRERDTHRKDSAQGRREDYVAWLSRRLSDAADVELAEMTEFQIAAMTRRGTDRALTTVRLPRVRLVGRLRVRDGARLRTLLTRGVGRHAAFGAGALLLRGVT